MSRIDTIGQNGNDGEHYNGPITAPDMVNHTPGPWVVDRYKHYQSIRAGSEVAEEIRQIGISFNEANARLIAAAPKLLEALTKCVEIMSNGGTWTLEDQRDALDAIAKATGEQQ